MKAIIIAAGLGSRLEHHTEDRPKCMVEVAGRSILDHQLHAFRENNIHDIHIIRGYLAEKLVVPGATYYENKDFRSNNILFSLFHAAEAMDGPFVTTYSDIVYTPEVVHAAINSPHDINLIVDRQWHTAYEGRTDHPPSEAELVEVQPDTTNVLAVGKQVGTENALGEFIGLACFTHKGGQQLREVFDDVRKKLGDDDPFHAAKLFRKAYLTDLFLELIARGIPVGCTPIDGNWREIDTVEDLARVNADYQNR